MLILLVSEFCSRVLWMFWGVFVWSGDGVVLGGFFERMG